MTKQFSDLFSGAGEMSCGLELSGMKCLLAIDNDKNAIQIFQLNHQNAKTIVGDINEISLEQIKNLIKNKKVDLICGRPPVKDFLLSGIMIPKIVGISYLRNLLGLLQNLDQIT